jgi:thiosulfate/3-mercaptopyruvate sulfurtransferase
MPREAIFESPGHILNPAGLRDVFGAAGLGTNGSRASADEPQITAYCNGGVAATSVLFALSILGYCRLTNYDGSWNEWNLDATLPVEK